MMADSGKGIAANISEKFCKELYDVYKKGGLPALQSKVQENLKEWQRIPLHIAVVGNSGSGKSSFINAFRGLTGDDNGAAAVGVVETTKEPKPYTHPENESLKIWDLPGVGTKLFPKETYLQQVDFERYDFFLIVSSSRFTENDVWLAEEVRKQEKRFYFIRGKIDNDVNSDKRAHPKTHSQGKVLEKVRGDTQKQLNDAGFQKPKVFLIDNYNTSAYDFGNLTTTLMQEAPDLKKEAFALSLTAVSEAAIREKEKVLRKRIYVVAIASAAAAANPIPGSGAVVNAAIILREADFYRKQLRIDDKSLEMVAGKLNLTVDEMQVQLNLTLSFITFTTTGILSFFSALAISEIGESVLEIALPLIGSLISSAIGYGVQVHCLNKLLTALVDDALKIHQHLAKITETLSD